MSEIKAWKYQESVTETQAERAKGVVCVNTISLPPPTQAVTIVVATLKDPCQTKTSSGPRKGIVYYGMKAMAWYCIADEDFDDFQSWAAKSYPKAEQRVVSNAVTCPPPPLNLLVASHAA